MNVSVPNFTKATLDPKHLVKNSYAGFYKNPTDPLVSYAMSQRG
jgi:hypothetical protein